MSQGLRLAGLVAALGVLLVSASSSSLARDRRGPAGPPGAGTANPSALVAAEIALSRRSREKGQISALDKFADETALMLVPGPVLASQWLSSRKVSDQPVEWEPYKVWMSCDGTLGFASGVWHGEDGSQCLFTQIWKQRAKKRDYRWVVDFRKPLASVPQAPDFLSAKVTDCPAPQAWNRERAKRAEAAEITVRADGPATQGSSDDGTLRWSYANTSGGETVLTVSVLEDGERKAITFADNQNWGSLTP